MNSVITVKCPECRGTLEIDVSRQRVLSHKPFLDSDNPKKDKAEIFDDVLKKVKDREAGSGDAFGKAQKDYERNQDRLEDLFGEAKEKIKKQKESGKDIESDPREHFWD
ncbi:MAG: hypothetical protein V3W41_19290 [Planctomycetota bacterium]